MILNLTYKNILYYLCLGTELNLSKKYTVKTSETNEFQLVFLMYLNN